MKTLTELSGSMIRAAAAAIAEAARSLPRDEKPAEPAVAEAPVQEAAGATGPTDTAASVEAPAAPPAAAEPGRELESDAAKTAFDTAVANATGLSGDRLTMLRGAVEVVGRRAADVRLVRVLGLEEQAVGATKLGAYQYLVDFFPPSMKQVTSPPKDDRGRRGGGRGGGRGGRGGGRGAQAGGTGGFSMDSLRDDRRNDRGGGRGRPGGGRRPGGGGAAGGGGPGAPPGGTPKQ